VSQFDIPHRLVINHVYEPQFFKDTSGVAMKILHGWEFNGIFQIQSGFPTNIFAGSRFGINDISLTGNGANFVRPSVIGDISKLGRTKLAPFPVKEISLMPNRDP